MKKYESFYKLLRETNVKEMVKAIDRMYYADKPEERCPYAYKGAYDQLTQMQPEEISNEEGYAIHVYQYQGDDKKFALTNCEGMAWKTALALPVIVEDSIELTSTETVAAIVWALTFYGFSESEAKKYFENLEKEVEEVRTATFQDGVWEEDDEDEDEDEAEAETAKLTPEEEEMKRLEERAEKVEHAMMELLSQSHGLTVGDLMYLLDTSLICEIWPHTYANDVSKRMDYLLELIEDYSEIRQGFNRVALCITSSPDFLLTDKEQNMLRERLEGMIDNGKVLMAFRHHEDIQKELQAIILFSKD